MPDTRRFKALLAALPPAARKAIDDELVEQAVALADTQRIAAAVDQGDLKASVRVERAPGRDLSILVKAGGERTTRPVRKGQAATYDYALGQEFGNEHAPAQPFFFPSYRVRKPLIKRGIAKAVKRVVGNAARGG